MTAYWEYKTKKESKTFHLNIPSCTHAYTQNENKKPLTPLGSKDFVGTSLVVQWLRVLLPMQGTWVHFLVLEDPTCLGATQPVCHNY